MIRPVRRRGVDDDIGWSSLNGDEPCSSNSAFPAPEGTEASQASPLERKSKGRRSEAEV